VTSGRSIAKSPIRHSFLPKSTISRIPIRTAPTMGYWPPSSHKISVAPSGPKELKFVKYTSEHTLLPFCPMSASAHMRRNLMEYKGVEYSVVQLTEGLGWRWEVRLDDGKTKSGMTPVSRAVAIKQAEYEIDRILKDRS
jgi:hypothetical protein